MKDPSGNRPESGQRRRGGEPGPVLPRLSEAGAGRRRAEGLFQGLLESAPDAVIVVDEHGRNVLVNRQAQAMFGYERDALLGRPVEVLLPARFRDVHESHRAGYADERRVRPMGRGLELFGIRADASEFPVEISLSPIEIEEGVLVFASVRDISERRESEAELRRLAAIVESSEDAIFAKDLDGIILSWNRGAERVYGYGRDEVLGRSVTMFAPPDRPREIPSFMQRIRRGESIENHETLRVRKDGSLIEVALTISPIRDGSGDIVGASVVSRDVTERRRMQAAQMLQRSLLPDRLPEMPGIRLAGRYVAGGADVDVGGDWYDALLLPDGRLCVTIGDVAGKGVRAASQMGQLRDALRALAFEGHTPAGVLTSLNRIAMHVAHAVATCVCIYVDPFTREATFASAGHPPSIFRREDGTTGMLGPTGDPPLGTLGRQVYTDHMIAFDVGTVLFMYTDGLVERRRAEIDTGIRQLQAVVEGRDGDLEALADRALSDLGGGEPFVDDVAVLAVSLERLGRVLTLELAVDARELARLRRSMDGWLRENGIEEEVAYRVVLATNEACANSIEHAYGFGEAPVSVHARIDEDIVVTVRDRGAWRDARGRHRGRGLLLMRALMDEVDVRSWGGGTEVELRASPISREMAGAS